MERKPAECQCKTCGNTFQGYVTVYLRYNHPVERKQEECPDCESKRQATEKKAQEEKLADQRVEAVTGWRRTCGIPGYLQAKTFENFERKRQKDALREATEWAKGFDLEKPRGYRSLIFYSEHPGVGKTHLMVAIANYLFDHWQGTPGRLRSPVLFVKGPHLVRRIRYTYNIRKDDEAHEHEEDVYRELSGVPLLLLDDIGKETPSNFTRETYWYIIDERVASGLPVIITSRLGLEDDKSKDLMGEDTVDRLYGMAGGSVTEMTGESYRSEKGVP